MSEKCFLPKNRLTLVNTEMVIISNHWVQDPNIFPPIINIIIGYDLLFSKVYLIIYSYYYINI